jgi:hypothetical protein
MKDQFFRRITTKAGEWSTRLGKEQLTKKEMSSMPDIKLVGLLGFFLFILGCAGTPGGYRTVVEQGPGAALPKAGTKVVVGGNHTGAVNQALRWLNGHDLLVVNRWVNQNLTLPNQSLHQEADLSAHALPAAQKVGAKLVVLVQVEETPAKDPGGSLNAGHQSQGFFNVIIQGMNAATGEVAFRAKTWNVEPFNASQDAVQDLTVLALEEVWQGTDHALSHPQKEIPEIKPDEHAPRISSLPEDPAHSPPVSQPDAENLSSTAQEPTTDATFPVITEEPVLEEKQDKEEAPVFEEKPLRTEEARKEAVLEKPLPEEQPVHDEKPTFEEASHEPNLTPPITADHSTHSRNHSWGLHISSGALSILYAPVKIVYAGLGGLFGGFAYALTAGNEQVAQSIWDMSLGGTYWLTPDHLQGDEPIRFKGRTTR